uniref:Uncharacterized protein n=1 Tax=Setaria viridis TaxID=4556 RepID=A0A4U6VUD1_SETVI|nr:hypothetical protein SEVIR_2G179100v2 [Setaria viridis]
MHLPRVLASLSSRKLHVLALTSITDRILSLVAGLQAPSHLQASQAILNFMQKFSRPDIQYNEQTEERHKLGGLI